MARVFCICLAVISWLGGVAEAQRLEVAGSTLWTHIRGVNVVGNYAYCTLKSGLQIYDVSDPAHPEWVGQAACESAVGRPEIVGEYAYVLAEPDRLAIIRISDPAAPECVGSYFRTNLVLSIGATLSVNGTLAYVFTMFLGVVVVDVSDPAAPVEAAHYQQSPVTCGAAVGSMAYIGVSAASGVDICVVDMQNPAAPVPLGRVTVPSPVIALTVQGDFVYAVEYSPHLWIVDVRDPAAPVLAGSYTGSTIYYQSVVAAGDYVYCGNGTYFGGVDVVDVSDPQAPALAGGLATACEPMAIAAGRLWGITREPFTLRALSLTNPVAPVLIGTLDLHRRVQADLVVADDYAYLIVQESGLRVIDLLNPLRPSCVATLELAASPRRLALHGSYLYVSSVTLPRNVWMVEIVDVSNPLAPVIAATYDQEDALGGVAISGHYLFTGSRVLDIADPLDPQPVATLPGVFQGTVLLAADGYLYVAEQAGTRRDGLVIFDVREPTAPLFAARYESAAQPSATLWEVETRGDRAYLAYGTAGLEILDLTDPAFPLLCSNFRPLPAITTDVTVIGEQAFIGYEQSGLCLADVHDARAPEAIVTDDARRPSNRVAACGNYVCVASCYEFSVFSYDVQGAAERPAPVADAVTLAQNYPNPFNGRTELSFTLPRQEPVRLEICNLLGQRVALLVDGLRAAGMHTLAWDAEALPSGLYYARLAAGAEARTMKMMLLK